MSARLAARRLALPGASRHRSLGVVTRATAAAVRGPSSSPVSPERRYRRPAGRPANWARVNKPKESGQVAPELDEPEERQRFLSQNMRPSVKENIFQDELDANAPASPSPSAGSTFQDIEMAKTREAMAPVVDPDPRNRIRWQRKKVMQLVRSGGRLTKEERIKMTERELLHKSDFLRTSVKKLVMLTRQIAGKTVDDAITQMKWSKKKMAAEIKFYLEEARDRAVVERGMGLGKVTGESLPKPVEIKTKDGKWVKITDPTRIYVAQSWVGRGRLLGGRIDYMGRGRHGRIEYPQTSFSVVLKEEKTRLREHDETEAKKRAKGPWVHLPNRSIHGQRPYYSW